MSKRKKRPVNERARAIVDHIHRAQGRHSPLSPKRRKGIRVKPGAARPPNH